MRLARVDLYRLNLPMLTPFETSFGTESDKDFLLVEASDGEHSGWGECVASAGPFYSEETTKTALVILMDHLLGRLEGEVADPQEASERMSAVRLNPMAKSAIETALWDLSARRKGVSLSRLIGGTRTKVPVGISIGIQPSSAALVEQMKRRLDQGYQRIKIKIKPGYDVEIVRAVRRALPDVPLMVDANSAYTLADTKRLKALDDFGLMMIEQPLGHDDLIDHAALQAELKTAICLDESIRSAHILEQAHAIGALRVVNIKIGRLGGLGESLKTVAAARRLGLDVWCGGMLESGVGRALNVAITSLEGFTLPGDTAATSRYFGEDIADPPFELTVDGCLAVPEGPGLGVDVIKERVLRHAVDHQVWTAS
jgi:O-succinylbenzoate synthase